MSSVGTQMMCIPMFVFPLNVKSLVYSSLRTSLQDWNGRPHTVEHESASPTLGGAIKTDLRIRVASPNSVPCCPGNSFR